MSEEEKTDKQHKKHRYEWLEKYKWKPGESGNPKGRPRGKSLKTRVKEILMSMDDEQAKAFLKEINPELIWRMAEGNPKSDTDITTGGDKIMFIPSEIINKNEISQKPKDNSQ
ncbi:MAG TPA: hypothetical protein ENL05_01800 [Candidatus Moranbacteria bacterium]|nr:hypothetical protein [Candidatus Moranbacteria bacterium]